MKYVYARVSTTNSKENRQTDEFVSYGITGKHIFTDKRSGKDFE